MIPITNKKILILSDGYEIREYIKSILTDHYNLILTDTPDGAFDCLKNDKSISLVFLGNKTSKINTLEMLNQIKQKFPDKKVVILTDHETFGTSFDITKYNADEYIAKHFKPQDILNTVNKLIGF